jgi:Domain of unknown function (DUF4386)
MNHDLPLTPERARFLGRWVGLLFLITYATSIPALLLFGPVLNDAHYVTSAGTDTQIQFAALLEFMLIVANIGSAVVLYPLVRSRFPAGAIGFVAARIAESAFIGIGILSVLSVVSLRASGSEAATLTVVAEALVVVKDWSFQFGPGFVVPIGNGMLLAWMMYQSGMVPRRLAMIGLVGGPVLFAASTGILFGALDKGHPLYAVGVAPEFIWELALGVYLTITGGRVAGLVGRGVVSAEHTAARHRATVNTEAGAIAFEDISAAATAIPLSKATFVNEPAPVQ